MLTPAKGRYPKPVLLQLSPEQRGAYSQLDFLHGGSFGDGRVRVLLHYSTGKDETVWLKIEDWHPMFRLPLAVRESVAIATVTTRDRPAEMCAQTVTADPARVLESLTLTFDPVNAPAAEEVPHDDRFSAGIFAISALPAPKPSAEIAPKLSAETLGREPAPTDLAPKDLPTKDPAKHPLPMEKHLLIKK